MFFTLYLNGLVTVLKYPFLFVSERSRKRKCYIIFSGTKERCFSLSLDDFLTLPFLMCFGCSWNRNGNTKLSWLCRVKDRCKTFFEVSRCKGSGFFQTWQGFPKKVAFFFKLLTFVCIYTAFILFIKRFFTFYASNEGVGIKGCSTPPTHAYIDI